MMLNKNRPLLLYDGDCPFCRAVVRFIGQRDRQLTLRFVSRNSDLGAAVLARHPELASIDSVVWLESTPEGQADKAYVRSEAALRVAAYLGGWWRVALIVQLVPRVWRDAMYDVVAKRRRTLHRGRVFLMIL